MGMPHMRHHSLPLLLSTLLAACAFDVVKLDLVPATLAPPQTTATSLTLRASAIVELSTGYARTLKTGTVWHSAGSLPEGDVFKTQDQVLTVEGSNIHEAYIVVKGTRLVGFYLPANGTYSPLEPPVDLQFLTSDGKNFVPAGGN